MNKIDLSAADAPVPSFVAAQKDTNSQKLADPKEQSDTTLMSQEM